MKQPKQYLVIKTTKDLRNAQLIVFSISLKQLTNYLIYRTIPKNKIILIKMIDYTSKPDINLLIDTVVKIRKLEQLSMIKFLIF